MLSEPAITYENLKRFFLRTLAFLVILLLIRILVGILIPYHTGGGPISASIVHIEQKKKPVDILFMGTSRIRRGIIPTLFDSTCKKNRNREDLSFNIGMNATRIGENLYLLKHFTRSNAGKALKVVFVEWSDTYFPHPDNRKTERARYWMDAPNFRDYMFNVFESHGPKFAWTEGHVTYITSAFIHRTFSLAHLGQSWMKPARSEDDLDITRGYKITYDHAPILQKNTSPDRKIPYFDSAFIRIQQANANELHRKQDIMPLYQDLKLWNKWLRRMKLQGVHMVLLIMPGQMSERQLGLARSISREHVLDLSDPNQYPDLYDRSVYYDKIHLNNAGGRLLTLHLAEAWKRMSP